MNKKRWIKNIIKKILYFSLFYLRLFDVALKILARTREQHACAILLYHRIVNDSSKYPNKGPWIHGPIKHFENEIAHLKKNYQILPIDEVVQYLKSGVGFTKPSVAITFDDGYLDNYTLAYPILKKHGVPATIYLATSLVGTMGRTWTDQIGLAFLETKKDHFSLPGLFGDEELPIKTKKQKEQAKMFVSEALKLRMDDERKELMRQLFETLEVSNNPEGNIKERAMLNWDEVQEMAKNGIIIGSHSHTHPILSRMPIQKAKEEIFKSKTIIEENLGVRVKHFAFPNGKEGDFNAELKDYCREIGFESVASVIYGTNDIQISNPFALKRIGAVSPVWMMAGELVKLFIRTNRI